MSPLYTTELVDTISNLHACLQDIDPTMNADPARSIAVDIEGVNLGRKGRIAIIQLYALGSQTIWLVDVTILGASAFNEADVRGNTLRNVLEGAHIRKLFWDLRNDSDALFSHFDIRLRNTYDLQVLELAMRRAEGQSTKFVHGLGRSVDTFGLATVKWKADKEAGSALFAPEKGGSYEVFEKRPLDPLIVRYCAQDVTLLFELENAIERRIPSRVMGLEHWKGLVVKESAARVALSQTSTYNGYGRHKALAMIRW